jgi:Ca-activated chloride channel homolog
VVLSSRGPVIWCCCQLVAFGIMLCLAVATARAQSDAADVHIEPRVQARPQPGSIDTSLRPNTTTIRKHVDLVLVPVTVTDGSNRLIAGLDQHNFQLYEDKQLQEIKHFSSEDAPVSIGILLDVSGSMATKVERAREALIELLKDSNPQDEFFLMTFANAPALVQDFTQNIGDVQNRLVFMVPQGRTALLDAIFLGIDNMKKAKYQRKALLVISDGGDNSSRYHENDVKSLVKESDVLLYSIGVFDREFRTLEERLGPLLLTELSGVTGASCYTIDNPNDLPQVGKRVALELRNQYVLGYHPDHSGRNGKWRKIKVRLTLPRGIPALRARARTGYYGPSQ